jgi:hypothetical protein
MPLLTGIIKTLMLVTPTSHPNIEKTKKDRD